MNDQHPILKRYPELKELIIMIRDEVQRHQRPACETILHDEDTMRILGVSKRKLEYMKANREIPFYDPPMQRDYFILSEILTWLGKYKVQSIDQTRRV